MSAGVTVPPHSPCTLARVHHFPGGSEISGQTLNETFPDFLQGECKDLLLWPMCHVISRLIHQRSHQNLCFPAVATVFKPYLFDMPIIQCHSSYPLKLFSFLPWSYSRSFSFLPMSGIFVFAEGLEHCCLHASASTRGLKTLLRKLFPIHSSPLLFVIFLYSGGQFGCVFSFLCC